MVAFVVRIARRSDLGADLGATVTAVARDGDLRGDLRRGDLGTDRVDRGDLDVLRVGRDLERERSSKFPP